MTIEDALLLLHCFLTVPYLPQFTGILFAYTRNAEQLRVKLFNSLYGATLEQGGVVYGGRRVEVVESVLTGVHISSGPKRSGTDFSPPQPNEVRL